ncbi:TPA: ead/Ea22-like family protein [Escherichia coli]|nr:ead/Ea22-like family protein [Escherichia coli]
MSNIDKQAHKMRNYLNTAVISGIKLLHLTTDELSALLDELEAKDRKILKLEKLAEAESVGADKAATSGVEWMKLYHAAEKRIAELEAKLDSADKLQDSAFRHGLQHGFSFGQTDNQAGFEECLSAYGARGKDNG